MNAAVLPEDLDERCAGGEQRGAGRHQGYADDPWRVPDFLAFAVVVGEHLIDMREFFTDIDLSVFGIQGGHRSFLALGVAERLEGA
jgi:hypothetical protein